MSALKERRKLEEKESLALLCGCRLPQKDQDSLAPGPAQGPASTENAKLDGPKKEALKREH